MLVVSDDRQLSIRWAVLTWKVMLMEPETSMQKSSRASAESGFSLGLSKNRLSW